MKRIARLLPLILLTLPLLAFEPINPNNINLSPLWRHARAQPDDISIACMPINDRGRTIIHNPSAQFPLASVSKLIIFIEYARRLESGAIGMSETVQVSDLNRYDLNRTDRGAHDDFLSVYPRGTTQISLYDVAARGMMRYSSNAASDYMLARLTPTDWGALYEALGMMSTSPPHPLGMIPLLMNNHDTGHASLNDVEGMSVLQGTAQFNRYLTDTAWRDAENIYRSQRGRRFPDWEVQGAILQQHTATGTAYDFIRLMAMIYGDGDALTEETKVLVRGALRWYGNTILNETYVEYGSKIGTYSGGTLTLVAYGHAYNSEPIVSVIFLRNVPRDLHREMIWEDTVGDFAHWVSLSGCGGLPEALATI